MSDYTVIGLWFVGLTWPPSIVWLIVAARRAAIRDVTS